MIIYCNIYKESVLVNGRMWTEDELDFYVKANNAPEKLYLLPNEFISYCRICDEDIEYTRTDALIEKTCEKLRQFMYDGLMYQGRLERDKVIDNCIKDFKKLLKEE